MRLAVTGASGLVGRAVVCEALDRGWTVEAAAGRHTEHVPDRDNVTVRTLDLRSGAGEKPFGSDVDAVVNAAAITDVGVCEAEPDACYRVNGRAPIEFARAAADLNIPFVHVSTHTVFDGRTGGYAEDDVPAPRRIYDLAKAMAEDGVRAHGGCVVRIMPVGVHPTRREPRSFGEWLIDAIQNDRDIELWDDVRFNPTTPDRCAGFTLHLLDEEIGSGIFHLGSKKPVSKAHVGLKVIAGSSDYKGTVECVSVDEVRPGEKIPKEMWVSTEQTEIRTDYTMPPAMDVIQHLSTSVR